MEVVIAKLDQCQPHCINKILYTRTDAKKTTINGQSHQMEMQF